MNYLKRGLLNTIKAIRKRKVLFVLLLVIQIGFLLVIAFTYLNFQLKILENVKGIVESLEGANLDADSLQEGVPFMDDIGLILQNYESLVRNIKSLVLNLLMIYLIFNGLLWIGSSYLLEKKNLKELGMAWLKFAGTFLIVIIPFILIVYFAFKGILGDDVLNKLTPLLKISGVVLAILYYQLSVSFSLITTKSWKVYLKKSLELAWKHLAKTIPIFLINLLLAAGGIYLIYLALVKPSLMPYQIITIITTFIFILIIILTRIYLIGTIRELYGAKNNY